MELVISISRPGKSWNLSEGHGKTIRLAKRYFRKGKNNRRVRNRL